MALYKCYTTSVSHTSVGTTYKLYYKYSTYKFTLLCTDLRFVTIQTVQIQMGMLCKCRKCMCYKSCICNACFPPIATPWKHRLLQIFFQSGYKSSTHQRCCAYAQHLWCVLDLYARTYLSSAQIVPLRGRDLCGSPKVLCLHPLRGSQVRAHRRWEKGTRFVSRPLRGTIALTFFVHVRATEGDATCTT